MRRCGARVSRLGIGWSRRSGQPSHGGPGSRSRTRRGNPRATPPRDGASGMLQHVSTTDSLLHDRLVRRRVKSQCFFFRFLFHTFSLFVFFTIFFLLFLSLSLFLSFGWWCWWTVCYCLWLVLIDGVKFSFSLTCFTLQNVSTSLGVLLLFSKSEGGFLCPRSLTARKIGANEDVSLLAGRRPLLSRWLCLLILPPFVTVFHLQNWLCKYIHIYTYIYIYIYILFSVCNFIIFFCRLLLLFFHVIVFFGKCGEMQVFDLARGHLNLRHRIVCPI